MAQEKGGGETSSGCVQQGVVVGVGLGVFVWWWCVKLTTTWVFFCFVEVVLKNNGRTQALVMPDNPPAQSAALIGRVCAQNPCQNGGCPRTPPRAARAHHCEISGLCNTRRGGLAWSLWGGGRKGVEL